MIGNTPIAKNSTVHLNAGVSISSLEITDGMIMQALGFGTIVSGTTIVSGGDGFYLPSRLKVAQGPAAVDFDTFNLFASDVAEVELLGGAWINVGRRFTVDESSFISGGGVIYLEKDEGIFPAFSLDGYLLVNSGVMEIYQAGTSRIDLDGMNGTGRIQIDSSAGAPRVLTISGTELNDTFGGEIDIRANARLNMNLGTGWTVDENGRIILRGTLGNQAVIEGSDLDYRGDLNVFHGRVDVNVVFYDTAQVEFFGNSTLLLNGDTTFAGASFFEYHSLHTASVPLIIQNGNLTVTEDTTLDIPLGIFDWDGVDGNTVTTVEPSTTFTINADRIDRLFVRYDGETNVGIGGQLVVNTSAAWENDGVIRLEQATLEGSGLVNTGLIQGSGKVSPARLDNRGTLRSFGEGLLAIGPQPDELGGLFSALPVDGIDAIENGVVTHGFDLDGTNENGVLVATDGDLRVDAFQGMFVFDGTLNIGFGHEYLMNTGGLHNRGTITITGGGQYRADLRQSGLLVVSLGVLGDAVIVSDNARFSSPGTNQLFADLHLQGDVFIEEGATFEGDGSLINRMDSLLAIEHEAMVGVPIENFGRLELGNIIASVEVEGFTNDATGTLTIDLTSDGGIAGSDYDLLASLGLADLAGTFEVNLLGGFMPTSGDEFIVLTAVDGVLGTFDTYDLPILTGDDEWFVRYESNEVILLVTSVPVPEPSTLLLAAFTTLGLISRRF